MNWEKSFSLFILLLSVAALWTTKDYGGEAAGPELAPRIWASAMLLIALIQLAVSGRAADKRQKAFSSRFWIISITLCLYLFFLSSVGYFISTFLFLMSFFVLTRGGWKWGVGIGLGWTAFSYLLFFKTLGVQLPLNPFIERWMLQ